MKPRDYFGVVVRTLGLLILFVSVSYLVFGAVAFFNYDADWLELLFYFVVGGLTLVVGLYFLRGAPGLVRFAYGPEKEEQEKKEPRGPEEK